MNLMLSKSKQKEKKEVKEIYLDEYKSKTLRNAKNVLTFNN